MDLQERMTAFAMLGAGWVLWLLVGLSVVGVAIILERAIFFWASREDGERLRQQLRRWLREQGPQAALQRLQGARSFEARIVRAGLQAADEGPKAVRERLEGESRIARIQMERYLAFLGTVGNNAPFVGLLGTVIGVIRAFHELDRSAGRVTSGLMAEIGEALVATAIGLLVALPAVASFNFYQRIIRTRLLRAQALGAELLAYLDGRAEGAAPPPSSSRRPVPSEDEASGDASRQQPASSGGSEAEASTP